MGDVLDRSGRTGPDDPPTPDAVATLDGLCARLRDLRVWAGSPSYSRMVHDIAAIRAARGLPPGSSGPAAPTNTGTPPALLADSPLLSQPSTPTVRHLRAALSAAAQRLAADPDRTGRGRHCWTSTCPAAPRSATIWAHNHQHPARRCSATR